MKLGELAARLGCTLEGDAEIEIHGAEGLEAATQGEVSFLSNPRYGRELSTTRASAVIVSRTKARREAKGEFDGGCRRTRGANVVPDLA